MDKIVVTTYDKEELLSMIKQAVREELAEMKGKPAKEDESERFLSMKDTCDILKVSMVTLSRYKKLGIIPSHKVGNRVYFKKGDVMKAAGKNLKYQRVK